MLVVMLIPTRQHGLYNMNEVVCSKTKLSPSCLGETAFKSRDSMFDESLSRECCICVFLCSSHYSISRSHCLSRVHLISPESQADSHGQPGALCRVRVQQQQQQQRESRQQQRTQAQPVCASQAPSRGAARQRRGHPHNAHLVVACPSAGRPADHLEPLTIHCRPGEPASRRASQQRSERG